MEGGRKEGRGRGETNGWREEQKDRRELRGEEGIWGLDDIKGGRKNGRGEGERDEGMEEEKKEQEGSITWRKVG